MTGIMTVIAIIGGIFITALVYLFVILPVAWKTGPYAKPYAKKSFREYLRYKLIDCILHGEDDY